jgi:YVTN family beta-propeller protein
LTSTRIALLAGLLVCAARPLFAAPFVYVSNSDDDTVTVIDAATNTVVATINVGDEPRNLAVSPDGTRVYVPNRSDDTVTVIHGTTNTVLTTIDADDFDEPYAAWVAPDGARVYIANKSGSESTDGSVTIINAATNAVITTVEDPCFVSPEWVTLNPAGTLAYVVNRQGDSVCVLSTATNTVVDEVGVGEDPHSAVVTCDGAALYVANDGDPSVSKVRTSDHSVVDTLRFAGSGQPRNMSITPDGAKIYVGLRDTGNLGVIDTGSDATSEVPLTGSTSTYATAVLIDGSRVFVTDDETEEVYLVNVASDTEITGMTPPIPIPVEKRLARDRHAFFVRPRVARPRTVDRRVDVPEGRLGRHRRSGGAAPGRVPLPSQARMSRKNQHTRAGQHRPGDDPQIPAGHT